MKDFLFACASARDRFCHEIQRQDWNTEMRTEAENLLIMYDQMMEKLKVTPSIVMSSEGIKAEVQKILLAAVNEPKYQ